MKKKTIIIVAAIILISASMFLLRKQESEENKMAEQNSDSVGTVVSDDGLAIIKIRDESLPDGVSVSDISIKREVKEAEGGYLYDLQPDGLVLAEPATFRLEIPIEPSDTINIPGLFHITEDGIEVPENIMVSLNENGDKMTISGDIRHFSKIYSKLDYIFWMRVISPPHIPYRPVEYPINSSFYAEFKLGVSDGGFSPPEFYTPFYYGVEPGTEYIVNKDGKNHYWNNGKFLPKEIPIETKTLEYNDKYNSKVTMVCHEKGEGYFETYIDLDYSLELDYTEGYDTGYKRNGKKKIIPTRTRFAHVGRVNCYEASSGMQYLGAQYFIDCGSGTVLTGYYKMDQETHEMIKDKDGNGLDLETGEPVVCPGG